MKVVQINAVCGKGSTGKIVIAISDSLNAKGIENYILYSSGYSNYAGSSKYEKKYQVKLSALRSRIFGHYGFTAGSATKRLIRRLDEIKPDIVHLHNIHGHNMHLEMFFLYVKRKNIKIYWTFHDCWAFTGYCTYFDMIECEKWKSKCGKCGQAKNFSWFFDRSGSLFERKKKLLLGIDLTIITPSNWLANLVRESFLKNYAIKVINNGINLSVFNPVDSDFREKHQLDGKIMILGVAFDWGQRKGLDVFIELSKRLGSEYKIVLVGTNKKVDKILPSNILSIHRTETQEELAKIYTCADIFVNPTREENFPTVNIESIACGTPVITFDTGGSGEMLDEKSGVVVNKNDIDAMEKAIIAVSKKQFSEQDCVNRAKLYDESKAFATYVEEYMDFFNNKKNANS